jgi:hypothetical protein
MGDAIPHWLEQPWMSGFINQTIISWEWNSSESHRSRALHSVPRSMRGPSCPSDKRGRACGASDSEGPNRGVVWMPCRRRERRCSRRWGGEMQHPIYFWNIQIQQSQHTSEDSGNTWNMLLKHLKKHLKTLENHCNHMQHPNKTHATYVWTYATSR